MVDIKSLEDLVDLVDFDLSSFDRLDYDITAFNSIDELKLNDQPIRLHNPMFALCLQGTAKIKVNLAEYDVPEKSLIVIVHDSIVHGYSHSEDFKGVYLVVNREFATEQMSDIRSAYQLMYSFKDSPVIRLSDYQMASLSEFYHFLVKKITDKQLQNRKAVISSVLQGLYQEFYGIFRSQSSAAMRSSRNEEIFYKFYELVKEHCKKERSVNFYAQKLYITAKHLSTMVKKVTGKTAGNWIDGYVILSAKVMLRSSDLTIQEISQQLNFSNQSFFGKYFRQHVGMSPSDYRNQEAE